MIIRKVKEYVGKNVEVLLFDGDLLKGTLCHNTKELPKNTFYINDVYFKASHIKRIGVAR